MKATFVGSSAVAALCLIPLLAVSAVGGLTPEAMLSDELLGAAASGDWRAVIDIAARDAGDGDAMSVVLLGHAALATGDNNLACPLFTAERDSSDCIRWVEWCSLLAEQFPEASTAHYLQGDAMARSSDFDGAIRAFTRAIELDGANALAYNARGVVHSIVKDRDAANVDWEQALALQPGMADVHANIAVYKIEGGGRSESALETVWAALAADPTFGMAQNTRACVLAAKGRFADADRALVKADSLGEGQNPFVAYNAAELAPFVEATDQLQAIMLRQSKPGKFRGMPRLDSFSISIQPFGIGLEATIGFNERGGVYLTPELVEVKAEDEPARFITDYLLSYPRGLVKGSLQ